MEGYGRALRDASSWAWARRYFGYRSYRALADVETEMKDNWAVILIAGLVLLAISKKVILVPSPIPPVPAGENTAVFAERGATFF